MNLPATEVKDFLIEFRGENRGESPRSSIPVTRTQAEALNGVLKKSYNKHIELRDEEGHFKELLETRLIKGIKRKYDVINEEAERSAVCDYGTRHPHRGKEGFEECNCRDRFKVDCFKFERFIKASYGVEYATDITKEMQNEAEELIKKQINKKQ